MLRCVPFRLDVICVWKGVYIYMYDLTSFPRRLMADATVRPISSGCSMCVKGCIYIYIYIYVCMIWPELDGGCYGASHFVWMWYVCVWRCVCVYTRLPHKHGLNTRQVIWKVLCVCLTYGRNEPAPPDDFLYQPLHADCTCSTSSRSDMPAHVCVCVSACIFTDAYIYIYMYIPLAYSQTRVYIYISCKYIHGYYIRISQAQWAI
jgi:hypothetical protein